MREVLVAFILLISVSTISAQSLLAKRAFEDATRSASAGNFWQALKGYRTAWAALEKDDGEFAVKLRYNIGVCSYRIGQLETAKRELTAAARMSNGTHARAYYALGMTETALENWAAARIAFLKVLELDPHDGEAWFDLAIVYLALRDYDQAAAAFRMSIENESVDSALGHNNLGVIMAVKGELGSAEAAFEAAIRLTNGRLIEARKNLQFCLSLKTFGRELVAGVDLKLALRASRASAPGRIKENE